MEIIWKLAKNFVVIFAVFVLPEKFDLIIWIIVYFRLDELWNIFFETRIIKTLLCVHRGSLEAVHLNFLICSNNFHNTDF